MEPFPPLRQIDAFPIEHEGETLICLHDPQGYVASQITMSPPAFFIAACLDGHHGVREIQLEFARQFDGAMAPADQIRQVADFLDAQGFLDNDRFKSLRVKVDEDFRNANVRAAYLAGTSYPLNRADLGAFIASLFSRPDGPGPLPESSPEDGAPLPGLIAPHIDFQRGALGYAHAYHHLYRCRAPRTVILFGVAHAGAPAPFILTRKDFATPFGVLENDRALVQRLAAACSWDPYAFEYVHRTEHSLEFQAVMLAYLYGTNVRIVPILCGQFSNQGEAEDPAVLLPVQRFLAECRAAVADSGGSVTVIAAADLAHVGRRFGDPFDITEGIIEEIARRDCEDLEQVLAAAPEAFYASVMQDHNERRVCGLGCIYAAMKSVEHLVSGGEVLHYGYAPDPAGGIVSFAGAKLY
jgi:hypothetical protein